MKKICRSGSFILIVFFPLYLFSQGSWNPPGANLSSPRILLDSADIPLVRATLTDPEILSLYGSVWQNAHSNPPAGNATDGDRITRAMIAKEAAFIVLMDRKFDQGNIVPLPAEEKDSLISLSKGLLQDMNTEVGYQSGWTFYNSWQHRSKELITCLIAYDLLLGAGLSGLQLQQSRDSLINFTTHLYQRAMATYTVFFIQLKFFSYQVNNHSIMASSALGLSAVLFNDHEDTDTDRQPLNWINAGLWNLDNTLWVENGSYPRVSEPDTLAGYAEGPDYFEYAFQNAFPFIRAMGNFLPNGSYPVTFNGETREIPNPWYDSRYDRLYDWLNKIRMPDGSLPAIHDSRIGFGTVIAALSGKPKYNRVNPGFTADDPFIRTQYIATRVVHGTIDDSLFQALPAAGSVVFRSSWDTNAVYLHFIGKHGIALTGAKSHHQGDATSFSLSAYGRLLAVDPGYAGASQSNIINKASDHNLLLVNGYGPQPPMGETVNTQTNTSFIENFFHTPLLDYGEVRSSYLGVDIIRKTLFIRSKYFFLTDFLSSPYKFDYTFQLHGNGLLNSDPGSQEGAFIPDTLNKKCYYQRDSVTLLAQIISGSDSTTCHYELDSLSGPMDIFRHYSKFLVTQKNIDTTLFLTTLFPYTSVVPLELPVITSASAVACRITDSDWHDFIFCTTGRKAIMVPADSSGLSESLYGNGKVNFFSETPAKRFSSAYIQAGDTLLSGRQPVIIANKKLDVAFENCGTGWAGFVSDSGVVCFFTETPVHAVKGHITGIQYDQVKKLACVIFSEKGNFMLAAGEGLDDKREGIESLQIKVFPNPSMDGVFTVNIENRKGSQVFICVFDLSGRQLPEIPGSVLQGNSSFKIDLNNKPAGCYILHICYSTGEQEVLLMKL
ncbi:MAG: T9SS type A sorting domain-containing protein [Bacteroidetes bacterium]|nr:T9SS type A sorting domain-containing protein [Bacteroidota bacterium]